MSGKPTELAASAIGQLESFRQQCRTKVLTFLFCDQVGSTRQQRLEGNVRAYELTKQYIEIVSGFVEQHGGRVVEREGDSFFCVFSAPSEGVRFALHCQAKMRMARDADTALLPVRMGLHQGQVVVEEDGEEGSKAAYYGLQVSMAARVMSLAEGNQILMTRHVFDDARQILVSEQLGKLAPVEWNNYGPYVLEGDSETYEICEVGEAGSALLKRPVASTKGRPADAAQEVLGWRPAPKVTIPGTNWEIEAKLGEGQFGEVWKAWNPQSKSQRVFKFCFKKSRIASLKREARILEKLRDHPHPAIVRYNGIVIDDKPPHYLELELIEGPSLSDWLDTNPTLSERLEVIAQVADGLDVAHSAGIYHRDIKPSNILLSHREDGRIQAKLVDFGVGATDDKELLETLYASKSETVAGTWDYIAPELKRQVTDAETGDARPSVQSDLYSLGLTLYQIVRGDLAALAGPNLDTVIDSPILRADIAQCLSDTPNQRPTTAAEFAQSLREHDHRQRMHRQRQRARRQRTVLRFVSAFALLTLVLGGIASCQWREAKKQESEARQQEAAAHRQAYRSALLSAQANLKARRFSAAESALLSAPPEFMHWEWDYMIAKLFPAVRRRSLLSHGEPSVVRLDHEFPALLTGGPGDLVQVWNLVDGSLIQGAPVIQYHVGAPVTDVSFMPDGETLLIAAEDGSVNIWKIGQSGQIESRLVLAHKSKVRMAASSPDGQHILTISERGVMRSWDAGARTVFNELSHDGERYSSAAFSSNSRYVASVSRNGNLTFWDMDTEDDPFVWRAYGERRTEGDFESPIGLITQNSLGTPVQRIVFSPVVPEVAAISADGRVFVFGPDGPVPKNKFSVDGLVFTHAAYSPGGSRIVTGATNGVVKIWVLESAKALQTLYHHNTPITASDFSETGRYLATGSDDGRIAVWDIDSGTVKHELQGHEEAVHALALNTALGYLMSTSQTEAKLWALGPLNEHDEHKDDEFVWQPGDSLTRAAALYFELQDVFDPDVIHPDSGLQDNPNAGYAISANGKFAARLRMAKSIPEGSASTLSAQEWQTEINVWSTRDRVPAGRIVIDPHATGLRDVDSMHISREGDRVLASKGDTIWLWRVADSGTPNSSVHADLEHVVFSWDETSVLSVNESGQLKIWDTESLTNTGSIDNGEPVQDLRFLPDSARVITLSTHGNLRLWDIQSERMVQQSEGSWDSVTVSPDGQSLMASESGTAYRIDALNMNSATPLLGPELDANGARQGWELIAYTPDGLRVAIAASNGEVYLFDTASLDSLMTIEEPREQWMHLTFDNTGEHLLAVSKGMAIRYVWGSGMRKQQSEDDGLATRMPTSAQQYWAENVTPWYQARFKSWWQYNKRTTDLIDDSVVSGIEPLQDRELILNRLIEDLDWDEERHGSEEIREWVDNFIFANRSNVPAVLQTINEISAEGATFAAFYKAYVSEDELKAVPEILATMKDYLSENRPVNVDQVSDALKIITLRAKDQLNRGELAKSLDSFEFAVALLESLHDERLVPTRTEQRRIVDYVAELKSLSEEQGTIFNHRPDLWIRYLNAIGGFLEPRIISQTMEFFMRIGMHEHANQLYQSAIDPLQLPVLTPAAVLKLAEELEALGIEFYNQEHHWEDSVFLLSEAVKHYRESASTEADLPAYKRLAGALRLLSDCYRATGSLTRASDAIQEAIELHSTLVSEEFPSVVQSTTESAQAQISHARGIHAEGEYHSAISVLDKAQASLLAIAQGEAAGDTELTARMQWVHMYLAWYNFAIGNLEESLRHVADVDDEFTYAEGYMALVNWMCLMSQGEKEKAKDELSLFLDTIQEQAERRWLVGLCQNLLGQRSDEELSKLLEEIVVDTPGKECEAYFYIGMKRWVAGDITGARGMLRKCVDTNFRLYFEYEAAKALLSRIGEMKQ
jgi:WD40 repeat protein/class 3 adenylate cyclase/tetratricopeptide (TPR) repeat protein/predicted Ser/Thr protein kinase